MFCSSVHWNMFCLFSLSFSVTIVYSHASFSGLFMTKIIWWQWLDLRVTGSLITRNILSFFLFNFSTIIYIPRFCRLYIFNDEMLKLDIKYIKIIFNLILKDICCFLFIKYVCYAEFEQFTFLLFFFLQKVLKPLI